MLTQSEIQSIEAQSLAIEHPEYRLLDALHEQVKGWKPGLERDMELQNIKLLKANIAREVFNGGQ